MLEQRSASFSPQYAPHHSQLAGRILTLRPLHRRDAKALRARVARGAPAPEQHAGHESGSGQTVQQPATELPRPPEVLGLGHMLPMTAALASGEQFEAIMLRWRRQYGPFVEWKLPGSPPVVLVADPEAIKEVYEVRQYPKSPRYMDLLPLLGPQSMLLTEGHVWRSQRDAFNPGFSSSFLKASLPGFVDSCQHLVQHLADKADRQEVVLMHLVTILTTLEIICKVGFGEDVNFLQSDCSAALFGAFEGVGRHVAWFIDNAPLNWLKNMPWNRDRTQRLQAEYDRQLLPILLRRLQEMGINVSEQEQQQLLAGASSSSGGSTAVGTCPIPGVHASSGSNGSTNRDAAAGVAAAAASECPLSAAAAASAPADADVDDFMSGSKDILSLAVKLSQQQTAGVDGAGVDLEMLMSQMKTFFAAGHDTTASLVAWTMYFLTHHPEVEQRLVSEVLSVMGQDTQPSYQQLSEMRYLNAVLKESLRVRPPVGVLARFAPEGSTLSGYDFSNKVVLVSPYVQHMDTDVWGADADKFCPERWLDSSSVAQHVSQYSYMPFSRGPRDCIGSRFALLEAKTILSMVYRQFEFQYASSKPEEVLMSVTAHPKYGVPLRVRRRSTGVQ